MKRATPTVPRRGFTLVELIVSMFIIVILASIAVTVVPNIMSQDRTIEGAARLQQFLLLSKSRAARDNLPRGVRLINTGGFATEIQYIEAPPLFVPLNPNLPTPDTQYTTAKSPRVVFTYVAGASPPYLVNVVNLPATIPLGVGCTIVVPVLGVWLQVQTCTFTPATNSYTVTAFTATGNNPYPNIGAGTSVESYQFGVYGLPEPLLGEPVQQLPSNVGVDIASSQNVPAGTDLVFNPAGDLMTVSQASGQVGTPGQVMLWVRDITKGGGSGGTFAAAGEQQVVSIKSRSGTIGVFPIAWTATPFQFAQNAANGS